MLVNLLLHVDDLELEFTPGAGAGGGGEWRVRERRTSARPCVLHANGPPSTKLAFGALANYLARAWLPDALADEAAAADAAAQSAPTTVDVHVPVAQRAPGGGRCLACEQTRFSIDSLFKACEI